MRWIALLGLLAVLLAPVARAEMRPPPFSRLDAAGFAGLKAAYRKAIERGHEPRTEQRDASGAPLYLNRLISARAPYLLQHAHNPVDWRPWGDAALAEAQALGRPIFLSVGYAACHWCHVMEAESFDDPETAALLNSAFVPVKVDREALPAVDAAYMRATEIIAGVGGWPNTLWLTPEGAPIFARTYLPRADLRVAAETIAAGWREDEAGLRALAGRVMEAMAARTAHASAGQDIDWASARQAAAEALLGRHNALSGGFSEVAQFPLAPSLRFLIDHWRRTGAPDALEAALTTLDHIAAGGLTDHVGGGFHRYTVDPNWAVPHFEKMLYTQAQLARVLTEAWEITRRPAYRRAAERALDYVLRDMTTPDGGFYAAEDADSAAATGGERIEGAFYAWTAEEVSALLGGEKAAELADAFSLDLPPMIEAGATMRAETDALDNLDRFDGALAQMRERRAQRPRPFRDEKVIAGWNGLMIEALSAAAIAFQRPDYLAAALRSAELIEEHLWKSGGSDPARGTLRRYLIAGDPAPVPAALNDYAYVALGFIALADASGEARWLELAGTVTSSALVRFRTEDGRLALDEAPTPVGRTLEGEDDILPTGESALIEALARLSRREAGYMAEDDARAALTSAVPAIGDPADGRLVSLMAAAILDEGESENRRALAHGMVRVALSVEGGRARVALAIEPGWHVNAHRPYDDMLVPTHLDGDGIGTVDYPAPHDVNLGFSDKPLSVIEGAAEIWTGVVAAPLAPVELTLTVQACSTEICLEPQRAVFRVLAPDAD